MTEPAESSLPHLTAGRLALLGAVLAVATAVTMGLCSLVGAAEMTWHIWYMRIVRLGTGALVGAGLGVAGMALQGLLRNPLADPYILGISSGASVGVLAGGMVAASLATGSGLPVWLSTPVMAMIGALATCVLVYGIAQRRGRLNPYVLLLSGVVVNVFNGAVILTLLLFQQRDAVLRYVQWGIGALSDVGVAEPGLLIVCGSAIVAGCVLLLLCGASFNALGLGDDVAASAGVRVHGLRAATFVLTALMTSASVALAGPIGFLGLIVPHLGRLLVAPDHRVLAVASALGGAIFLMLCDTLGRWVGMWINVGEVPVGVITALSGGPFFIILLRRRFKEATQ